MLEPKLHSNEAAQQHAEHVLQEQSTIIARVARHECAAQRGADSASNSSSSRGVILVAVLRPWVSS